MAKLNASRVFSGSIDLDIRSRSHHSLKFLARVPPTYNFMLHLLLVIRFSSKQISLLTAGVQPHLDTECLSCVAVHLKKD